MKMERKYGRKLKTGRIAQVCNNPGNISLVGVLQDYRDGPPMNRSGVANEYATLIPLTEEECKEVAPEFRGFGLVITPVPVVSWTASGEWLVQSNFQFDGPSAKELKWKTFESEEVRDSGWRPHPLDPGRAKQFFGQR